MDLQRKRLADAVGFDPLGAEIGTDVRNSHLAHGAKTPR